MKLIGRSNQRVIKNLLKKDGYKKKNGYYQKGKQTIKLVKEGRYITELITNDLIKEFKELGFVEEKENKNETKTLIEWGRFKLRIKY